MFGRRVFGRIVQESFAQSSGISVIFWSHCGFCRIPLLRVFWFILVLLIYRCLALLDILSSFCVADSDFRLNEPGSDAKIEC